MKAQVPVAEALGFRPTEGPSWAAVLREYLAEHPVIMTALQDDLACQGMTTPLDVFCEGEGWAVHNGHHRLLAADLAGLAVVPVTFWEREADIPRCSRYWDPETRSHYSPEEDEHDEGQPRY